MSLTIHFSIAWETGESTLDLTTIAQLLEFIAETGTVRAAANKLGISYRTAWGKLDAAEKSLGQPLIVKSKGHGSKLTPPGNMLKAVVFNLTSGIQSSVTRDQVLFERAILNNFNLAPRKLKLACSHDSLIEACAATGLLPEWTIRYMGSQKAIDALRAGAIDMAGFHLPEKLVTQPGMKELWADSRYFVLPVMCRELGLVVARGNPLQIRTIEDLLRPEIRFINRQKNSGTRLRLHELLRSRGLNPALISGYQQEEFTHSGVALAVLAKVADAAFALRSASTGFDVDFIPVGRETYCFCGIKEVYGDCLKLLKQLHQRLESQEGYSLPLAESTRQNSTSAIARWVDI